MAYLTRSYYHAYRRASPLLGRSLGQQFYLIAEQYPDKEMYVFFADKERKTFKEMKNESQSLAASFLSLGVMSGDRIGVWGGNHYEWLVTYLACMQLGLVLVHVRMDFTSSVQKEILKKLGCKALILTRTPENLYDNVCEIVPELRSCAPEKLESNGLPDLKFVVMGGNQAKDKRGMYNLDSLLLQGSTSSDRDKVSEICLQVDMDSPAIILFTSGSTGFPKAVTHSSHSFLNFIHGDGEYRGNVAGYVQPWETRFALIMNLAGIGAQLGALLPICKGCTTVVVSPSYDKELLAKAFHEEKCTDSIMLIHHMYDLLDLPNLDSFDFSANQIILAAGSIVPLPLRERAKKIGKMSLMAYGGTEILAPFMQHPTDKEEKIQSAAYLATGGTEVKVVDDNGFIVPVNTTGEIHVRGYTVFLKYWGDEEKTRAAKDAAGWWHSGDIGIMDEDGFIRVVGRKSDSMIIEGINISPYDLEKVLHEHPNVANVMVVGVPDKRTSEAVCVCVILKPETQLSEDEVKKYCENKVSSFLIPRYVLFMEEFSTTPTGKFNRRKVAQSAAEKLNLAS